MTIFNWIRLYSKKLWCHSGFGSMLIEFCHDCGVRQPLVWWADNALWSELTGEQPVDGDNMAGILCPNCFDKRASQRGILLRWRPEIEYRKVVNEG